MVIFRFCCFNSHKAVVVENLLIMAVLYVSRGKAIMFYFILLLFFKR